MALKTFNIDAEVYKVFSDHCKKEGISMSKKVDKFIREEMERLNGPMKQTQMVVKKRGPKVEPSFKKYC